jgi:4-diphosphocytidyl-2-C-methyl-D-erythritol kinase
MQFKANAKINLGLFISSKRPDGYHEIESIFLPIDWSDRIEFRENNKLTFTADGLEIPPDPKGNLILRAYEMLKARFDLPLLEIHLDKQIPIGAGLGGGSSDAAHMLKALNAHFQLGLTLNELVEMAAKLGSDCAFFIENRPAIARGRGEILDHQFSFSMSAYVLTIVPPIHVSTSEAYSAVQINSKQADLSQLIKQPMEEWKNNIQNDFEASVFALYPQLKELKASLYGSGATYASMSGSGSAIYGIFTELPNNFLVPEDHQYRIFELKL